MQIARDRKAGQRNAVSICRHCRKPMASGGVGSFCCAGCETAFEILRSNGLERYYELAEGSAAGIAKPRKPRGESFGYLDDPGFVEAYAENDGARMRFYLEGAHCAACVWVTERLPVIDPAVERVRMDLSNGVATVDLLPGGSFAKVADEFATLGYFPHPIELKDSDASRRKASRGQLLRIGVAAAGAGNLMIFSIALYAGAGTEYAPLFRGLSLAIYLPVFLYAGMPFLRGAFAALRNRRLSVEVPIAFGLISGTLASLFAMIRGTGEIYFDSLAGLIFLLLSSRYLLFRVQARAADASHLLRFLAPSRARVLDAEGSAREVRAETLVPGERIEIPNGSIAPVDGALESEGGVVTLSWMTGETESVKLRTGDVVLAGSRNEGETIVLRVSAVGTRTRLGKILDETEKVLKDRVAIREFVDRIAGYFVPLTFFFIGLGFWMGLSHGMNEAIARAVAVAIVVCPCALAMAVPLAMSFSIGRLSRRGVLVRGAEVIERLSKIERVLFDKTGTLTAGELTVVEWLPKAAGLEPILVGLEAKSPHPIAAAIRRKFEVFGAPGPRMSDVRELPGIGVSGVFAGKRYALARSEILKNGTEVTLTADGVPVGTLCFADPVRAGAGAAIRRLETLGLETEILSGDNRSAVEQAALRLGVCGLAAHSGLSPEEKAAMVRERPNSAFVGDGANDAIALATASVGFAVQGGLEVSMRAAGIYCASGDPLDVPRTIEVAQETMRVIRRCLTFTAAYNVLAVSIALWGRMNPCVAAILMPFSALGVFLICLMGTRRLRAALGKAEA